MHEYIFSWFEVIEHGTIIETCAIDALLTVTHKDRDYWTYSTNDKGAWIDFLSFKIARAKAIRREFMQRYA